MAYFDIAIGTVSVVLGTLCGLYLIRQKKFDEEALKKKGEKLLTNANNQSTIIKAQSKEKVVEKKKQFELEQTEFVARLDTMEKILSVKIASNSKREAKIAELRAVLQQEEKSTESLRNSISGLDKQIIESLCKNTGLPVDRVKESLLDSYEDEFKKDGELRIQHTLEWAQESALRSARNILSEAIYRFTDATSVEHGSQKIIVPRDEIKGRIVGRGGRMIAFFEELFGVDVIFNDEPNTIIVSCFNLVQQEVARIALERLTREKIITEEVITRTKVLAEQEVDKILRKHGEQALITLGLTNMPADFVKLVGRLSFRTSYGQNIMRHCFEVGYFARLMASEIGADVGIAWLGGFFHDIGKAIDQEVSGSHDVLTKEILEKYGFSWEITHAAWTHHNAIPQETIEAKIVQAADAISASRPGARAESMERYLTKIKDLQETALSFAGAKKAYAINAGREVRVFVDPEAIDDAGAGELASQIAAKVQEKGGYPGKIKITTIRTTKVTDYAR